MQGAMIRVIIGVLEKAMAKEHFYILNNDVRIPAVMWGNPSNKLLIAVHGNLSNKEDTCITITAQRAAEKGYRVLSFDLPEHGERTKGAYACIPQNCVSDLTAVYEFAGTQASDISLFACSLGAYFSLLAYHESDIKQALFLSPVVSMERLISNMMGAFHVSEQRLKAEKQITLPIGQTLDWDYYSYVKENPICFPWNAPTSILYGSDDNVSDWDEVSLFTKKYMASIQVLDHGEHYFHTEEQLRAFDMWLTDSLL